MTPIFISPMANFSVGTHTVTLIVSDGFLSDTDSVQITVQDTTPPTVTVNQASGQAEPTPDSPINFTVVFSEPVSGFGAGGLQLTGSAGVGGVTVTGSGTTYNVALDMVANGTTTVSVVANAAQDAAGNSNIASTSTDNTVSYNGSIWMTGIVRDATTNAAIANARVFFYGSTHGTVFTDASGVYTFTAANLSSSGGAVSGTLYAGKAGYYEAPTVDISDLSAQPSLPVVTNILLKQGGSLIQGTITDSATGNGIAGATVSFSRNPMSTFMGGATTVSVQTDATGNYAIDSSYFNESGLTSGFSANLMVNATGYIGKSKSVSFTSSSIPVTENFSLVQ